MKRLSTSKSVLPAGLLPRLGERSIVIQLNEIPLFSRLEHFCVEGSLLGGGSGAFACAAPDLALGFTGGRVRLTLALPLAA